MASVRPVKAWRRELSTIIYRGYRLTRPSRNGAVSKDRRQLITFVRVKRVLAMRSI